MSFFDIFFGHGYFESYKQILSDYIYKNRKYNMFQKHANIPLQEDGTS